MKTKALVIPAILICSCTPSEKKEASLPPYPEAPSVPVTENYFGRSIKDDYRNLENLEDSLTLNWFKAQSEYTQAVFNRLSGRDKLIDKMEDYDKRKPYDTWYYRITGDDQHFFLREESGENAPKLYYRKNFNSPDELVFDSKDFKPDEGHEYRINYIKPSWDGAYVAVALSYGGAEISEMIIIDMKTRKPLPQVIGHCWPSDSGGISWLPDNSGFIYLHYPVIDANSPSFLKDMKSVVYKIGQDPEKLHVIFSRETQKELNISEEDFPGVSIGDRNDKYMRGRIGGATAYFDYYYADIKDLGTGKIAWKSLYKKEDKVKHAIFRGDSLLYLSAKNVSNFRILSSPLNGPADPDTDTVLADPKENEVINDFEVTSNGIYFTTTKNGVEGKLYHIDEGKEKEIKLPKVSGRVNISSKGLSYPDLWVSTMGWVNDYIRYKYNPETGEFTEQMISPNGDYPEFRDFVVKELSVPSHDGKDIPLSVIHKKNVELNGENPTLLYGYGSYGHSISPFFSPAWLTWVEEGGILCVAHVRGGGEKGDRWYQDGKKERKPNTWKDLISCTEYMIKEGYTSNRKTVINGGSAGGILIGRAMTERPDLFAVAIPEVGVMNALRGENGPNGPNNIKEFGTAKDSLECMALIEMDAYLHIKENEKYPATLITTGMNDPRVVPWQPGKFAAKLQKNNGSDKPVIFSVDYESGHGMGDSKAKQFEQLANTYAFAFWQTGKKDYRYGKN